MQKIFRSSLTVEKIGGRFKQPNASIRSVPFLGLGGTRAQSIQSRVRNPLATALMSGPQFDSLAAKVLGEFAEFPIESPMSAAPKINVDFFETATEYHLDAELPGLKKADISLHYDEEARVITIEAKKETRFSSGLAGKDDTGSANTSVSVVDENTVHMSNSLTKAEKKAFRRQHNKELKKFGTLHHKIERSYGYSSRSLRVPDDAELEFTKAIFKDGLLVISMARNKDQWEYKEHPSHIKDVPVEGVEALVTHKFDM